MDAGTSEVDSVVEDVEGVGDVVVDEAEAAVKQKIRRLVYKITNLKKYLSIIYLLGVLVFRLKYPTIKANEKRFFSNMKV